MQVILIQEPYKSYSMHFWDEWIGPGEIDCTYLTRQMLSRDTNKLLLLDDKDNLEGLCIFSKVPCFHIYRVHLIAKKHDSQINGVGKMFIDYLQKIYGDEKTSYKSTLLLSDDSQIPNYYENLGFFKTKYIYYKWLLDDWFYPLYYRYI